MLPVAPALADPPLDAVLFVEQGSSACAGARLDGGRVLTAYHCVAAGGRVRLTTREGSWSIGRVVAVDRARDLAVVQGPPPGPVLSVSDAPPRPGDPVSVVGHPLGALAPAGFLEGTLRWSVGLGVVSAVGPRAVQLTAPVNPGNSGGPVLDGAGDVVGVVSRRLSGDGLGFAGRVDGLDALLARPARRMGPLGGALAAEILVQANGVIGIPLAVGGRLELALRDRLVVSGSGAAALGARWAAVDLGEVAHEPLEARIGVRQRVGRGPWTVRADAWGGVGALETITADGLDLGRESRAAPMVGGRLAARGIALDYGVAVGTPFARLQVHARFPGTLTVF